ncbi:MAG TPA: choice-of-anchor Q domain-containing protein, partial [Hanamia sp.]|nr:choice-of-anchor Q domain-containing protein [Hanamia sp.]
ITGNTTWNKTLPYVIIGGILIDSNATLTIEAGTRIFLHADAPFLVDGSLKATGTKDEPVVFAGDRLDQDYKDLPASWPGIYFRSSSENNSLTHVIIKNAYQGIVASGVSNNSNPKINLSKCRIDNIYDAGILAINTNIYADNCLISNCGSNIDLESGGDYRFINCTVVSYGTNYISHQQPVLKLFDYLPDAGSNQTFTINALFRNCIFWGDGGIVDNEISIDRKGSLGFSATFDHVLYKAKDLIPNATFISSIQNEAPMFDSIDVSRNIFDFHFTNHPNSPAINAGVVTAFPTDLDDKPRDSKPDIGCYER